MLVRALGLKPYVEVWDLQKRLVAQRQPGEIEDTLLCEHLPVYTRGQSSKAPVPPSLPHPLHTIERGGDITYHGPGQLVGYPIVKLEESGLRPRSYLRFLEETLIQSLRPFGAEAESIRGFTGLWLKGKKIASIGVCVKGGVAFHGFSLNVSCDLAPFSAIYPCNLQPDQMTTLEAALGRALPAAEVAHAVAETFLRRFTAVPLGA